MKKLYLLLIILLLCGCKENSSNHYEMIEKEDVNTPEIPSYVDDNPIRPSIYIDGEKGGFDILENEYKSKWIRKKDILVLLSLYTDDSHVKGTYFQDVFYKYAKEIDNFENYKIGWEINFSLKDGTNIHKTILRPNDSEEFYDYLEIYLYDSANIPKDTWYSHLLDKEITDKTLLTTIKLTAGSLYDQITSPIMLKLFTYDEDDFDNNGFYKGESYKELKIVNE